MSELLLGIDVGTSGCKIIVIDRQGRVVDEGFGEYKTFHPHPGHSEQDGDDWCRVACKLLRAMFDRGKCAAENIAAISLDGSTHNAVLTDAKFKPLRRAIMWTDQRSTAQAARLEEQASEQIFQTTYQRPSPTWTLPQVLWIKEHEPEMLDRTAHVFFTKDYVRYRLTGTWETDHIEAQGSLLYDMKARDVVEKNFASWRELMVDCMPPLVEHGGRCRRGNQRGRCEQNGPHRRYARSGRLFRYGRRGLRGRGRRAGPNDPQNGYRRKRQCDDRPSRNPHP